jgi:SAM-dependent methyltransferase
MIDGPSTRTSDEVRSFYDRYPYPPPVESLDQYRKSWQDKNKRRADFHLYWPHKPFTEDFSILIAGCGTSQAAKHAIRWPGARITAIDLSATSIRCTEDLKRKYNLTNLEIHQLPLDQVGKLNHTFDQIVCTGVLHHLPDPDSGLAALGSVLAPAGAMHLMLYAPYGRAGIYMLQEFCRLLGIRPTDAGIRDLMSALRLLPPGHPLETLLREAPDFRHESALADALLHPQDRAYSVPQLFDFIERAHLSFGRWIKQAPYLPQCGLLAQLPQAARMANLPAKDQYAAAELFRGNMLRHSAIVYHAGAEAQISFAGNDWPGYIPIRLPDTVCIEERLPPGAAAVLINRGHTNRDLVLPISAPEKRLFDAIDGTMTIDQILPSESQRAIARAFFERLWHHDQVVFVAQNVGLAPS